MTEKNYYKISSEKKQKDKIKRQTTQHMRDGSFLKVDGKSVL